MNRKNIVLLSLLSLLSLLIISSIVIFILDKDFTENEVNYDEVVEKKEEANPEYIKDDIVIKDIDGNGTNYEFIYNKEVFRVVYTYDNWKLYDSYKITNINDMKKICQALINIHPIHGSDMVSYRIADDMVYEWALHNIAYELLPENNEWKENAKDVDFDPADQGKSLEEIYENRTGKTFNSSAKL